MNSVPRVAIIIQARLASTRLPGKVLMDISGRTMLAWVVGRLQRAKIPDEIIVATTVQPRDDAIVEESRRCGAKVFRGSEEDVLDRYYQAATRFELDIIGRVTSDEPLMDPRLVDEMLAVFLERPDSDYCSNSLERTYPRGLECSFIKYDVLQTAWQEAAQEYERVHVVPFIREHPERFNLLSYTKPGTPLNQLRLTVDTWEDLEFMRRVFQGLDKPLEARWEDAVALLAQHPDWAKINEHIRQKNIYEL
jgi:spore coat polysaccharide biosynthesis protein SpsF